jgi:hypothetical protein
MDRAELLALPVSFDLVTAARALHLGRTKAHELARRGEFPVRVLRLGNRYRVTRADLLRFLGEPDNDTPGASVTPPPGHATAPAGVA